MIEYTLINNEFGAEPEQYKALVFNSRSYTFDDIAKYLITHNTGLSRSVIYGLWEGIKDAVVDFSSRGGTISTEIFKTRLSIKGTFKGLEDRFDPDRHEIRLNLRPGPLLYEVMGKLKVKKQDHHAGTLINSVNEVRAGSAGGRFSPGMIVRITGQRLKIAGDNPSCGLYFISDKAGDMPLKVEATEFVVNKPSELITVIPGLNKGSWKIRVVTQFCKGRKLLKKPQSATFDTALTVV